MTPYAHYAANPLPCSVPLAVVLYGAGNHQPVVSRKVTFACDEIEDFTDESYVEKEKAKRAPVQKRDSQRVRLQRGQVSREGRRMHSRRSVSADPVRGRSGDA